MMREITLGQYYPVDSCHAARKMQLNHKQNVSSEQSRIIPNICEFE